MRYILFKESKRDGKMPYVFYSGGKWREDYGIFSEEELKKGKKSKKFGFPAIALKW